jgi:hypothetical protein
MLVPEPGTFKAEFFIDNVKYFKFPRNDHIQLEIFQREAEKRTLKV